MDDSTAAWMVLGITAVLILLYYLPSILRTDEQRAWAKRNAYVAQRMAAGLSHDEVLDECAMREQLAEIRELISDHVRHNGTENWETVLTEHIRLSAVVLSSRDPKLAKRFLQWMATLNHSDFLYPHEYEIVYPKPMPVEVPDVLKRRVTRIINAAYTDL